MAQSLAFFGLMLQTEVPTATLFSVESIVCHEFANLDKVGKAECLFELDVEVVAATGYVYFFPERLL